MPPRNIVRSGNAGMGKSAAKDKDDSKAAADPTRPPPLFPGFTGKTPMTILNERCQKEGWERAVVDTKRKAPGFTALVTLRRHNKKTSSTDTIRLEPHPPFDFAPSPTAALAKHYGATYALFRFANGLSLHRILPPGPRDYWAALEAEKKKAPEHQAWMWEADPFAAAEAVKARQAAREKAAAAASGGAGANGTGSGRESGAATPVNHALAPRGGTQSKAWALAPEVRIAPALRELVESTIRAEMTVFPDAVLAGSRDAGAPSGTSTPTTTSSCSVDVPLLTRELTTLGFRPGHVRSALSYLSSARQALSSSSPSTALDPLLLSLSTLSDRDAALEWLLLHVPEDDLPPRFAAAGSGDPIVASVHAGKGGETLERRWMVERVVKEAGFPRKAVGWAFGELEDEEGEGRALDLLCRRLAGWHAVEEAWGVEAVKALAGRPPLSPEEEEERAQLIEEEILALESVLGPERFSRPTPFTLQILIPPSPSSPTPPPDTLHLHIHFHPHSPYPSSQHPTHPPTFHLASPTLPSYIRLALAQRLMRAFRSPDEGLGGALEAGQGGAVFGMVEWLEEHWQEAVENPPDVGKVTRDLLGAPARSSEKKDDGARVLPPTGPSGRRPRGAQRRSIMDRDHARVREEFERMRGRPEFGPILKGRERLPAWKMREEIVQTVGANRVVVIVGETGCGKTTQLPQFILDHEIAQNRGASTSIVITQPRRVAALGVASRVAQERLENLDGRPREREREVGTVGYAIRGERRAGRDTRLLFCTTGVVLRRLGGGGDADLEGLSHIIIDEAHERSVDSDFLLTELRELLKRNKTLRVIIMSATINEELFTNYFPGAPLLRIPGLTYPVTDLYLEDYISKLDYRPSGVPPPRGGTASKQKQSEEQLQKLRDGFAALGLDPNAVRALETLSRSDRIDYQLIAATATHIARTSEDKAGAILIFLPGVAEIKQCIDVLRAAPLGLSEIIPLHANLSSDEQRRVFQNFPGRRKIVVATNVAETSITIDDVVYVIESGKVKETQYSPENGLTRLVETWTSRASARQRRGRAGRVKEGQCFRLYTRKTESDKMPQHTTPEMLRVSLESLFLNVKAMREEENVKRFLGKALTPPRVDAMDKAWEVLQDLGALESEEQTSKLSALGKHMSLLPVDVRLAKMLVLSAIFGCLDPIVTIAACLSSKPLFNSPVEKRAEAQKARERFATGNSDLLTDANAYLECARLRGSALRSFCEENFISFSTLRDIHSLRSDFAAALSDIGFLPLRAGPSLPELNANSGNENLLKAIILAGLYPQVARVQLPSAKYQAVQAGTVQMESQAKEVKIFDKTDGRVFLHPGSVNFSEARFRSPLLAYFSKFESSKIFLRDSTEVPLFGALLFGGPVHINQLQGGMTIGKDGYIKMRGNSRIAVLVSQLRRLLDAHLEAEIERPALADDVRKSPVITAMLALLERDGLSLS